MADPLPSGDNPIVDSSGDLLGRDALARIIAAQVTAMDKSHGAVVGILGGWGTGKTSLLNLVTEHLAPSDSVEAVIHFNPWMFAGFEQITAALLSELASSLRKIPRADAVRNKVHEATEVLSRYAGAFQILKLIPVVGTAVGAASTIIDGAERLTARDESIGALRMSAQAALAQMSGCLVVAVDDIDRLSKGEIRDLFRAVRLSAQFPNVVYLLCLDHQVVAAALDEPGFDGHDYLEKILTLTVSVPSVAGSQVRDLFLASLGALVTQEATGPFDDEAWQVAFPYVIAPLLTTLRDSKRLLTTLPIALRHYGGELPLVDVVTLEALRVLRPQLHAAVIANARILTSSPTSVGGGGTQAPSRLAALWEADSDQGAMVARGVVGALFPGSVDGDLRIPVASRTHRGVSTESGLDLYITGELAPGAAVPSQVARLVDSFGNLQQLRSRFAEVASDRLADTLEALSASCDRLKPAVVGQVLPAFVDLFDRVVSRRRGIFESGGRFAVSRLVYRVLRLIDADMLFELTRQYVSESLKIYPAYELVMMVGHRENVGHGFVSEDQARILENLMRTRLIAEQESLGDERELMVMLYHVFLPGESPSAPVLPALLQPRVAAAVFSSAVSESTSTDLVTGRSSTSMGLHWDLLVRLFAGEDNLRRAWGRVKSEEGVSERCAEAVVLIGKYLDGWRPEPFPWESSDR